MAVPEYRVSAFTPITVTEPSGTARLARALVASREHPTSETERVLRESAEFYAGEARRRQESPERLVIALKAIFGRLDGRLPSLADPSSEPGDSWVDASCGAWYSRVFAWCLEAYYSAS